MTSIVNHCIIYEHELSDEAECGYILTENKDGGNFSGVCHGKDQAVSFKNLSTYPRIIMHILGFFIGNIQNT